MSRLTTPPAQCALAHGREGVPQDVPRLTTAFCLEYNKNKDMLRTRCVRFAFGFGWKELEFSWQPVRLRSEYRPAWRAPSGEQSGPAWPSVIDAQD